MEDTNDLQLEKKEIPKIEDGQSPDLSSNNKSRLQRFRDLQMKIDEEWKKGTNVFLARERPPDFYLKLSKDKELRQFQSEMTDFIVN